VSAVPANSDRSVFARLVAKYRHSRRRFRRAMNLSARKNRRDIERDFKTNVMRCLYPAWYEGVEL